jgi:hypothetical protein
MDKRVYHAVSSRAEGYCEVCHQYHGDRLELHHILRRKIDATKENCVMLCGECHRGTAGIHGRDGHELDLRLKLKLQRKYFKEGYAEDEVRKLMNGRLYIRGM